MTAKDLLIEIGLEEVPARFVRSTAEQFREKMTSWLNDHRLQVHEIQTFATPRRIALIVKQLPEKQPDLVEEVRGPSRKAALTEDGEWSKAAQGFAKSQGASLSDLYFKEHKGAEYVYAKKSSTGVQTRDLLLEQLPGLITSITFPRAMRWGSQSVRFIRPIRWLTVLFGNEVIPAQIAGLTAGDRSKGHRFLGREIVIESADQYAAALKEQYVHADFNERKQMITEQIEALAREKGWHIAVDEDLLEEVVFLVEYPTVLYGSFNEEFLDIPQEVLITSMREHQRYFPVLDEQGKLLPYFVTVRNGNADHIEEVARGNEKVLRARLSDARFFYQEDLQLKISDALEKLETVVYHEELGTLADKTRRIVDIAARLSDLASLSPNEAVKVQRAAEICKFDLVTQMVYEFPELQGVMGEDYALKAGEEEDAAKAVFEHYLPRHAGDDLPQSVIGSLVSIADKIDSIVGCFSIGIVPTGSQDPYALRRQASGIVQIVQHHDLPLTLSQLFAAGLEALKKQRALKRTEEEIISDLKQFFAQRVRSQISELARYDVIDAITGSGLDDIKAAERKTRILAEEVGRPDAKSFFEALNRVNNLAGKASSTEINPELFEEAAETALYNKWKEMTDQYGQHLQQGEEKEALELLKSLAPLIHDYFDHVMVMADQDELRNNRLAFLAAMSADFAKFADFSKLVWDK